MLGNPGDTIAAVASGAGQAGIGVVRVSGDRVPAIAQALTGTTLIPRHAHYLTFRDANEQMLDRGIALYFPAPHSMTGEDVLELQGHGGAVVLDMVLQRVLDCGARMARPGEFSERAFHNDKMDLAQAEAISDLISSSSQAAARAALRSMTGEFSAHVNRITEALIDLRVWLEAALDFSEEDIDFLADASLVQRTRDLKADFNALLTGAEQGQRLRDGLTVVFSGAVNAGKSSLLNCLSGDETAIVTPIAGTTRDVVRTDISIEGVPVHIVDTAGLRDTDDPVEQLGIERARKTIETADHVLRIIDASDTGQAIQSVRLAVMQEQTEAAAPSTVIFNKTDLLSAQALQDIQRAQPEALCVSAKTGHGLDDLRQHILSLAGHDDQVEQVYSARRRHLDALIRAREYTDMACQRLETGDHMPELAAEELLQAQRALEAITGRFDNEALLGRIFSGFCIGK